MADTNTANGTAAPTGATQQGASQAQPASGANGFTVPAGHRLVTESDWAAAERNRESAAGAKQLHERVKKWGFNSLDDIEPLVPAIQTIRDRKIDPAMFSRSFSPDADADIEGGGERQPQFDPKKFEQDFEAKMERKLAEREWESMTKREKEYVDLALRDAIGDEKVDEMSKSMYRMAIERWLDVNRDIYPKGHPLHESHLQPLNETHAKKAVEWFNSERTKYAGSAVADKADAVIAAEKKGATSAAGKGGGNGAPERKRPGQLTEADERAQIQKAADAMKARRQAGR